MNDMSDARIAKTAAKRAGALARTTLRAATVEDIDALIDFTRKVAATTRWAGDGIDEEKFRRDGTRILAGADPHYCVLLLEAAGNPPGERIQGLVFGLVQDFFWSSRRQAVALVYALTPTARGGSGALKLLTAFRRWAENRNADELAVAITSADRAKATGNMLARMGFRWVGGNYVFDLAANRGTAAKEAA